MIGQAATVALAAFNLVCAVTETTSVNGATTERRFQRVFRIDLTRGRWCDGACTESRPVVNAGALHLSLYRRDFPTGGARLSINRETGALLESFIQGNYRLSATGPCERARFTGLPARRF